MNAQFREIPNLLLSRWNDGEDAALARIYESHYTRLKQRAQQVIANSRNPARHKPCELVHATFFRLQRCQRRDCRTVDQLLDLAQRHMQEQIAEKDSPPSWMKGFKVITKQGKRNPRLSR